jgi:hypothetical protein
MITVPAECRTEIEKLRGRKLYARVRIDYSDSQIDNTMIPTASSVEDNTYLSQTFNGKEDVSLPWASLDGSWILGTHAIAPTTVADQARYEIGWWNQELSNADKTFQDDEGGLLGEYLLGEHELGGYISLPELTLTFTPRTFSDIRISFDNAREEYAEDFDVIFYDATLTEIDRVAVTGNTGLKYVATIPTLNSIYEMHLLIRKWSHVNRQAKVAEFFTSISELYEGDDIISLSVDENRELSGKLPVGTTASGKCVVKLFNRFRVFDYDNTASKLYNVVRAGARISPEIGDGTTWISLGVFFAREWDIPKRDTVVTVSALDHMSMLGESEYKTSQIIQAPADETYLIDTDAEWNAGTLDAIIVDSNSIRMEF